MAVSLFLLVWVWFGLVQRSAYFGLIWGLRWTGFPYADFDDLADLTDSDVTDLTNPTNLIGPKNLTNLEELESLEDSDNPENCNNVDNPNYSRTQHVKMRQTIENIFFPSFPKQRDLQDVPLVGDGH